MIVNKQNNWLKFKIDFFASLPMKKIRKIAGGDSYIIIYQKLMLLTVNSEGHYHLDGIENTIEEELALIIDEDVDNVKIAVNILKSLNLIEQNNNMIFLNQVPALIGKNNDSSLRVAAYRERKKLECNALQPLHVTESNAPRERERGDKEIEKKQNKTNATKVADVVEFNFDEMGAETIQAVKDWIEYRKLIKKPIKTQIQMDNLRKQLWGIQKGSCNGVNKMRLAIQHSISNGYQGLFEAKYTAAQQKLLDKKQQLDDYLDEVLDMIEPK